MDNKVVPDASPEGTCQMFFTMPLNGSDIPKDLKPEEYKKYKNDLAEKYIRDYEQLMGINIMDHIEEISIATPVTFARYLGTPEGTIYGYRTSGWDNVIIRNQSQVKDNGIKNLCFCGGHGILGDGYSSAYKTGEEAGIRVVNKLKGGK